MATFKNIYYKRTAASAKACYICYRPTTTVLATINTTDFIYTCDGHLTDRGFATLIEPSPQHDGSTTPEPRKVSDEEIRRVKEEWEERQRQKKEKEKQEKAKQNDKAKKNDKDATAESDKSSSPAPPKAHPPPPSPIPVPGSSATKPTHQRYTLHRDIWAMRLAEHKKRRQTTAVKEVAPRLPPTPQGGV